MALTEVIVAEMALSRMGISRALTGNVDGTLASCTDTSLAKEILGRWMPRCLDRFLIEWPWTFARKFARLVLADDGTDEAWGDEWDLAYVYPADCIKARRFVNDRSMGYLWATDNWSWPWHNQDEWAFVVRLHADAQVILTDVAEDDADLEYTERVTVARVPEVPGSVLAWLLASEAALPLGVDPSKAQFALSMYKTEAWASAAHQTNEQIPYPEGDSTYIRARQGY